MAANDMATLNGLFKIVYNDKIMDAVPDNVKFSKLLGFVPKQKNQGLQYNQAVVLGSEHGVTYGGTEGEAFQYAQPISGQVKQASIKSAEMVLRGQIARAAISRSQNLTQGAFKEATKHVVENMLKSAFQKHEAQCFYGGVGLGAIASVAGVTITLSAAEFAPGIWVGGENMKLEFYDVTSTTKRTSGHASAQIVEVDLEARTLKLDQIPADVVATDVIYEFGAKGKEFIGVHKMLTAVNEPVFGINPAQYSLWRGNKFNVNGALSFKKISQSIALPVAKGVSGKLTAFVNPKAWSDLLTEQSAQRIFVEGGVAEYKNGAKSIMFYSQNGDIEIIATSFVKEGYAYILDLDTFERVGSSDITFEDPVQPGKYIENLTDSNAVQMIAYCDCALFCKAIGRNILLYGIVNS
jgi:hypothetical protein